MEQLPIKDSSGKITGHIERTEDCIRIANRNKPILEITDKDILKRINSGDKTVIVDLFDDFTLLISEIAVLFGTNYSNMNKIVNSLDTKTRPKEGRRNSSFGQTFSEERRKHIGQSRIGTHPSTPPYERTPEIRAKISETLKEGYKSGRITVNKEALSQAWGDDKYDNSPMGRGIQGYVTVSKNVKNKDVYFRSLLGLNYVLNLEEDINVTSIVSEPFHIPLEDGSFYTPDFLVDDKILVELKPHNHLKWRKDSQDNRFEKEISGAEKYCQEHNLEFRVIYDSDLNFETGRYKRYLLSHPEIIEKYNIRFNKELKTY